MKWKRKRDVCVICNANVPELTESFNGHGKLKSRPNAVHLYNQHLSVMDLTDQILYTILYCARLLKVTKRLENKS